MEYWNETMYRDRHAQMDVNIMFVFMNARDFISSSLPIAFTFSVKIALKYELVVESSKCLIIKLITDSYYQCSVSSIIIRQLFFPFDNDEVTINHFFGIEFFQN